MLSPSVNDIGISLTEGESHDAGAAIELPNDERLMERFRDGDSAAFEHLYRKHRAPLFRFVLRAVSERGTAEELAQDVWIRLIDAKVRYRVSAKFQTYLYRIAHNRVIDHYRRKRPIPLSVIGDVPEPSVPDCSARDLDRATAATAMRTAIAELPLDQRTVFLLRAEQNMSLEQIAQISGVGRETIKSRLRYATNKLREALSDAPGVNRESV